MMVPVALTVTVAGTSAAAPAARRLKEAVVTVAGLRGLLNVALTVVFRGIPIEFGVGVCKVTVGRVAMVNVKVAGALTLPARSVAITLKVYTPSGCAGKVIGEVQGAKASAPVESEHWKVTLGFEVNAKVGVLMFVGVGGWLLIVAVGGVKLRPSFQAGKGGAVGTSPDWGGNCSRPRKPFPLGGPYGKKEIILSRAAGGTGGTPLRGLGIMRGSQPENGKGHSACAVASQGPLQPCGPTRRSRLQGMPSKMYGKAPLAASISPSVGKLIGTGVRYWPLCATFPEMSMATTPGFSSFWGRVCAMTSRALGIRMRAVSVGVPPSGHTLKPAPVRKLQAFLLAAVAPPKPSSRKRFHV